MLAQVEKAVRQDIVRLRFLVDGKAEQDTVTKAVDRMNLEELLAFQETLRTKQHQCTLQLPQNTPNAPEYGKSTSFQMQNGGGARE